MASPIDLEHSVFSCQQKGSAAVLRLKQSGFSLLTDVDVRADYFDMLSRVEDSPDVTGVVMLNTTEYRGVEAYRDYIEAVQDVDTNSVSGRRTMLSLNENSLSLLSLHAASYRKPVVAGYQGPISAHYLGLSLAFDFRIATEDTVFEFPISSLGSPIGGAVCLYLPKFVGQQRATEIILQGHSVDAATAKQDGFVNEVVKADELEDRCVSIVESMASLPPHAVAATRALLHPEASDLRAYLDRVYKTMQTALVELNQDSRSRGRIVR